MVCERDAGYDNGASGHGIDRWKVQPDIAGYQYVFHRAVSVGAHVCNARVIRLGRSIGFLAADLFAEDRLIASATSTVKLVPTGLWHRALKLHFRVKPAKPHPPDKLECRRIGNHVLAHGFGVSEATL